MSRLFTVKARRPERAHEVLRHWMDVGIATEQEGDDNNILITLNALPFEFDGELKLVPKDNKKSKAPVGAGEQK